MWPCSLGRAVPPPCTARHCSSCRDGPGSGCPPQAPTPALSFDGEEHFGQIWCYIPLGTRGTAGGGGGGEVVGAQIVGALRTVARTTVLGTHSGSSLGTHKNKSVGYAPAERLILTCNTRAPVPHYRRNMRAADPGSERPRLTI